MLFFMSAFRQYLFHEYQNLVTTSEKKRSHFTNKVHKQLLFLHYLCRTCRQPYCHCCQHINHEDPFWVNTSLKLHSNIINNHVFISYLHITLKHLFLLIVISLNFGIHTRYLKIILNHFSYLSLCIINSIYSSL